MSIEVYDTNGHYHNEQKSHRRPTLIRSLLALNITHFSNENQMWGSKVVAEELSLG